MRNDEADDARWKTKFVQPCRECLHLWLAHDLDILLAFFLSTGLLVISIFSYLERMGGTGDGNRQGSALNARANLQMYKAQIASSVLLTVGSLLSMIISHWRKQTSLNDGFIAKRRAVLSFLQELDNLDDGKSWCTHGHSLSEDGKCDENMLWREKTQRLKLSGTPLTDVYSVYRLPSHETDEKPASPSQRRDLPWQGEWHKIPALLLAKGDYIALQVGDNAPAKCALVSSSPFLSDDSGGEPKATGANDTFPGENGGEGCSIRNRHGGNETGDTYLRVQRGDDTNSELMTLHAGERLTIEKLCSRETDATKSYSATMSTLPPGRLTLQPQSKDLLELCNNMKVFVVCESPTSTFLYREDGELAKFF